MQNSLAKHDIIECVFWVCIVLDVLTDVLNAVVSCFHVQFVYHVMYICRERESDDVPYTCKLL
jgi:hypothetical protein